MPIAIREPPPNAKHFLIVPHVLWDHVESSVDLAGALLASSPDMLVTLLVPSLHAGLAAAALTRHRDPARLHVVHTQVDDRAGVALPQTTAGDGGARMTSTRAAQLLEPALKAITTAYERLLELQPLTDACSDCPAAAFDIAPCVALVDAALAPLAVNALPKLNIAANIHVKLVCWTPLSGRGETEGAGGTEVLHNSPNQWDGLVHLWPACLGGNHPMRTGPNDPEVLHISLQGEAEARLGAACDPPALSFLQHHTASRGDHSVVCIALDDSAPCSDILLAMLLALHRLRTPYLLALPASDQRAHDRAWEIQSTDPGLGHLLPGPTAPAGVLAHPGIMALVTRGSSAAVLAAINHAVPLVFCPESCDQAQLARAFSAEPHRIGMKLHRESDGAGRPRTDPPGLQGCTGGGDLRESFERIFEDIAGSPGRALRERIEAMRDEVRREVESGDSRRALELLVDL